MYFNPAFIGIKFIAGLLVMVPLLAVFSSPEKAIYPPDKVKAPPSKMGKATFKLPPTPIFWVLFRSPTGIPNSAPKT